MHQQNISPFIRPLISQHLQQAQAQQAQQVQQAQAQAAQQAQQAQQMSLMQQQMDTKSLCTIEHNDISKFYTDKFELMVDVKGYKPENLRVNVLPDKIEILAQKLVDHTHFNFITARVFNLPQKIFPLNCTCFVNTEGILNISAPWTTA